MVNRPRWPVILSILAFALAPASAVAHADDPAEEEFFEKEVRPMLADHERLTYRYSDRDSRLTDVSGNLIREILA